MVILVNISALPRSKWILTSTSSLTEDIFAGESVLLEKYQRADKGDECVRTEF